MRLSIDVTRGTGEAAPKKHLMTLLNRRRMNSRNASRGPTPKNRRAASASSRVEGQSQTPHHSRFEGYGYGDGRAISRCAAGFTVTLNPLHDHPEHL